MSLIKKRVIFKWFSLVAISLLAITLLMLSWLYTTESGLQWLTSKLTKFQPQALRIGKITGRLNSKVKISNIYWQQDGQTIKATGLEIDCQWLHLIDGLVSCDKITLATLDVTTVDDKTNQIKAVALPELANVTLPIAVKVKQISIAKINYKLAAVDGEQQYKVSALNINKLAAARSKVSVKAVNLQFESHDIAASGYIDMRKQWQHQLELKVQGTKLSVNAQSKGHMRKSSQLTLRLQAPNQLRVNTEWFFNKGLFLKRGSLIAEKQQIDIDEQTIFLEKANAAFALNWPKLTSNLHAQASWNNFENIKLDVNTELGNILDWRASLESSLHISSALNDQQIAETLQQLLPDVVDNKASHSNQSWPITANVDMTIKQSILSIKSDDVIFGDLTASLQGALNVDSPTSDGLSLKGQVNGHTLAISHAFQVADINAYWQIEKQQSKWRIVSKGHIEKFALAQFEGDNINWSVDFTERWQANVKADKLKVNDVDVAQATLSVTGLPEQHHAVVSAKVADNTTVKLVFDGQLGAGANNPLVVDNGLSDNLWQINNLDFTAQAQAQTFAVAAEQLLLSSEQQSIKNLCLSGTGTLCVNGDNHLKQWTANLTFEQWSISEVVEQARAWQSILPMQLPQQVQGKISGQLKVKGSDKQLKTLMANLSIPSFTWQAVDFQVQGQALAINSEQNEKAIVLTTQWQDINSQIESIESRPEISMPNGKVVMSYASDSKLDFSFEQSDIVIEIPKIKDNVQHLQRLLTIPLVKIDGKWQKDNVSAGLQIVLPGNDKIAAQLNSEWPIADDASVSGELSLSLQQFDWLKKWQKRIDKIELSLLQDFTLAGTWTKPLFDGQGSLSIERLVIDEYGLDISNSKIKLSSVQDSITLLGELQNPQGALTISGQAKLSAPIAAELTLEGQHVTLVNNNENKLIVSPKLQANYQNQHLKVDGHIVVEQADIKIASLPKSPISVSEDQVIVGEKDISVKTSTFDYDIALKISAGNNVRISGFGLSSAIEGNLSSTLISGQPLTLNGRLDLKDGQFQAYKQVLTIEQGQLLFLGAAENPSIQFRAVRIVDDIKVGIIADGTIHNPRLTLFSEPTLADENILALLITGRNLDSLTKQEGNALTSAAISLGVESANKVVQKIGEQLGLKDIAFTSKDGTNGNSTRVDLAAKINDRLNVGYGTSIDSDNSIQAGWIIEYKLSPHISFEATSGEEISANINYKKQFSPRKNKEKTPGKVKE